MCPFFENSHLHFEFFRSATDFKYGKIKSDLDKVITKSNARAEGISAAKHSIITQMNEKLNNPLTAPQINWKIKHGFMSNKKSLPYHLYLFMEK